MNKLIALHTISNEEDLPFDDEEYSLFKYGSKSITRKFAKKMAKKLHEELPINKQLVIMSAPYLNVPVAGTALTNELLSELNIRMLARGMESPIQGSKIYRPVTYMVDYSNLSKEGRDKAIGSELFHTDASFLENKTVIFVDDIRVTGSHEERIINMIERQGITSDCFFLYFAVVAGDINPIIESNLNHARVKILSDLDEIIEKDEYIHNTRNTKFILNESFAEFTDFIKRRKKSFRRTLYCNAMNNGYFVEPAFVSNLAYLRSTLKYF